MRAGPNAGKGSAGQSFVKGQFEELDWGANLNVEHDLGTDLWLMARDDRRFDLRELVGAQVKTGQSYFASPERDDSGAVVGWWYAESDDSHFDYWCDHSIPHLLVLHDLETHTSHWVHVTRDKLHSTGKGRKILVPAAATVDNAHFDDLVRVAMSRRPSWQWEGSAWDGASAVSDSARLRYALVTPRLVAPHPNKGERAPDAMQAIAMLVQMRISDIQRPGEDAGVDTEGARRSESWEWRLFAALYDWVTSGTRVGLEQAAADATSNGHRVAATVCIAVALLEDGRPEEAAGHIRRELDADGAGPTDRAWLLTQLSQCLQELGDLAAARQAAMDVQATHHVGSSDPTASAFMASAGNTIFNLGDWDEPSLAGAIRSGDTAPSWWRSQTMASGLAQHFDEGFRTWVGDKSTTYAADTAWLKLRSAMLLAGYAGDRPGWRNAGSRLARRWLMTADDEDSVVAALDLLRLSGDDKLLGLAASRVQRVGPAQALIRVGTELDLAASTRASLHADIEFIRSAADVLPEAACNRFVDWALATLADPTDLHERLRPTFLVADAVLGMLRSLVHAASMSARSRVMEHVLGLPALTNQLVARGYGLVLAEIPTDEWTSDDLARLRVRPDEDNWEFSDDVATLLARTDPAYRETLETRIQDGDLAALHSFGRVTDLRPAVARDAIENLGAAVRGQIEEARRSTFTFGRSYDALDALVLLNAWHPSAADWSAVIEILALPTVNPEHVSGGIRRLASLSERVPDDTRERLRSHLERISGSTRDLADIYRSRTDPRSDASIALAALYPDEVDEAGLRRLLAGDASLRSAAIEILATRRAAPELNLIAALANDHEVDVRLDAIEALAYWVVCGAGSPDSEELLASALPGAGPQAAVRVSGLLAHQAADPACVARLAESLVDHPSATVRARARRALDSPPLAT